jgi:hypothetical protein
VGQYGTTLYSCRQLARVLLTSFNVRNQLALRLCLAKTSILFEISVMFWRLILK